MPQSSHQRKASTCAKAWAQGSLFRAASLAALWLAGCLVSAQGQNVQFIQTSDPAGIVEQQSFPVLGSVTNTVAAPQNSSGYQFCYWTINGVRFNDLLGVAANPVTFTASAPIAAVAHYLPQNQDSNNSGWPDAFKLQYFGTLNITLDSDPVGDGFTIGQKLNRGWNPATFNVLKLGGISRRRGEALVVVPGYIGPRDNLGGISRRRSGTITVVLNNAFARLNQISDPPAIINTSSVVFKGSTVNLSVPPDPAYGYRFTGWLTNGARVDSPTQKQPIPLTVTGDTMVVARYILESADTLNVGIPDWLEWFNFNQIGFTTNSDPVGDGIPLGMKIFRGYSLAVPNELAVGGISRRRSANVTVILNTNSFVRLNQISDPPGILSSSQVVARGSRVNLSVAPDSSYGYRFTGWLTNGMRVDSPTQKQPIPLVIADDTTVTARYILESADTLGVGIPDWLEWFSFNEIGFTPNSDPDGDGLSLGLELYRGYSIVAVDELQIGGVSRRRSPVTPVNYFAVPPPDAQTGVARQIGMANAILTGNVNPQSLPTSAYFEYGLTNYENLSQAELTGSGTNLVAFSQFISGLLPGASYHFRIVAFSKSGLTRGSESSFTTAAGPLAIQSTTIAGGMLTFSWTCIPGNQYRVQYSTNLVSGLWLDVGNILTATSTTISASAPVGDDAQRFYRVALLSGD